MSGLRVALLEDHDLFADALALALRVHGHDVTRIEVPGHVRSVDSLVAPLLGHAPDVVLMDLDLGLAGSTARIVEPLSRARIAVVVVTGSTDRAQWGECLHHGARRVVPRIAALQDVVSTLRRIEMGVPVIARERRRALIGLWRREEAARRNARERLDRHAARRALAALQPPGS